MTQGENGQTGAERTPPFALVIAGLVIANAALALGASFVRIADTGPVAAAFWRMTLAAPVLFLIARQMGEPVKISNRALIAPLFLAGIFFAGDLAAWHLGILQTRLANATLFGNAASLFYPIWGFFVVRSLPSRLQVLALLLGLAGAVLLLGRSYELSPDLLVGDLLCLTGGILYTFYLIAVLKARESLPSWSLLSWSTVATALPLLIIARMMGEPIIPHNWAPVIGLAITSQLIGQGLLVWVIDKVSPLLLGLALMTQPVVAAALGWIVFDEALTVPDVAGALLVMTALILVRR